MISEQTTVATSLDCLWVQKELLQLSPQCLPYKCEVTEALEETGSLNLVASVLYEQLGSLGMLPSFLRNAKKTRDAVEKVTQH